MGCRYKSPVIMKQHFLLIVLVLLALLGIHLPLAAQTPGLAKELPGGIIQVRSRVFVSLGTVHELQLIVIGGNTWSDNLLGALVSALAAKGIGINPEAELRLIVQQLTSMPKRPGSSTSPQAEIDQREVEGALVTIEKSRTGADATAFSASPTGFEAYLEGAAGSVQWQARVDAQRMQPDQSVDPLRLLRYLATVFGRNANVSLPLDQE